jgi:hypothetical protein
MATIRAIRGSSGEWPLMTTAQNPNLRNRLLAVLSPDDFALLAPHLREVPLLRGDLLHRPGEQIEQVHFLTSGIVSLLAILERGGDCGNSECRACGHHRHHRRIRSPSGVHLGQSAGLWISVANLRPRSFVASSTRTRSLRKPSIITT